MNVSRRQFLVLSGAGLTTSFILPDVSVAEARTSQPPLVLFASARVPLRCRVRHALFAPRNPCPPRIPDTMQFAIWRPQDGLMLEFELRGVRRRMTGLGYYAVPASRDAAAQLCVRFPSQHLIEGNAEAFLANGTPAMGQLAAPRTQLVFKIDDRGIPLTPEGMLNWLPLCPVLAENALPPVVSAGMRGIEPAWTTRVARYNARQQAVELADKVVTGWRRPRPTSAVTRIAFPAGAMLSPHGSQAWRTSVPVDTRIEYSDEEESADTPTYRFTYSLWNALLTVGVQDAHGRFVEPTALDRQKLMAVRVINSDADRDLSNGTAPPSDCTPPAEDLPSLPTACDFDSLTATTGDFGYASGADRVPVIPATVEVQRLLLTSLGASADLLYADNLDRYEELSIGSTGAKAGYRPPIAAWTHRASIGRDDYVMVAFDCRTLPLGTKATLVQVKRRQAKRMRTGNEPPFAAGIEGNGRFEEGDDPAAGFWFARFDNAVMDYADFGKDKDSPYLREMGFVKARVLTKASPGLQFGRDDDVRTANRWLELVGNQPFMIDVELTDRQGAVLRTKMQAFLAAAGSVVLDRNLPNANKYEVARDAFRKEVAKRTTDLGGQRVALVQPPDPSTSKSVGNDDGAVELQHCVWDVNDVDFGPAQGDRSARTGNLKDWSLRFFPRITSAGARFAGASAFSRPSTSLAAATAVRWYGKYLSHGFVESDNPSHVYLETDAGTDTNPKALPKLAFNGGNSGGLATPSIGISHISRIFGPMRDETTAQRARREARLATLPPGSPEARLLSKKGLLDGGFDPKKYFQAADALANLIGGVSLSEAIAPLKDAIEELERVPKLIEQQLRPVTNAIDELRDRVDGFLLLLRRLDQFDIVGRVLEGISYPITPAKIRQRVRQLILEQKGALERMATARLVDLLLQEAAPIPDLLRGMRIMLQKEQEKYESLYTQLRRRAGELYDEALADERVLEAFKLAFEAQAVLDKLRELSNEWSDERARNERIADWIRSLIESYTQALSHSLTQWYGADAEEVVEDAKKAATDFFNHFQDTALFYGNSVHQFLTGLQYSLPRAREALLGPLLRKGVLSAAQLDALRARFDALPIVQEANTTVQGVIRQLDSFEEVFSGPVDAARDALDDLVNLARQRPAELFGQLPDRLERLLRAATRQQSLMTLATVDDGPAVSRLKYKREELARLVADQLDTNAITGLETYRTSLQNHLDALRRDVPMADPELAQMQGAFNDYFEALKRRWNQGVDRAQGGVADISNTLYDLLLPPAQAIDQLAAEVTEWLKDIVEAANALLAYIRGLLAELPQEVKLEYTWSPALQDAPARKPIFKAARQGRPATFDFESTLRKSLRLNELASPPEVRINATLKDFRLILLPSITFVTVDFRQLKFVSVNGSKPKVTADVEAVEFGDALDFVKRLSKFLSPKGGPTIELNATGVRAAYGAPLPRLTLGAFNLSDLSIATSLVLPFDGSQVLLGCNVSTRDKPFLLTIGILGGGGFFGLTLSPQGVHTLEAALEFGAAVDFDISLAKGKAKIVAGLYFKRSDDLCLLSGYFEASGTLRVIGLINITLKFYLSLTYIKRDGQSFAEGEVIVTVEIEFLFFSKSVDLKYTKRLAGGNGGPESASSGGGDPSRARLSQALNEPVPPARREKTYSPDAARVRQFGELRKRCNWQKHRKKYIQIPETV